MAVGLTWRGAEFERLCDDAVAKGLEAATLELHTIARQKASVSNVGVSQPVKRIRAGGNKTQRTIYPFSSKGSPTPPGESPRRRTGFGQKNIVYGFSRQLMQGRVGYTRAARYMTFHELGIRYGRRGLQYRQTILPALRDNLARLRAIFKDYARGAMR